MVTGPLPNEGREAEVDMLLYKPEGQVRGSIGEDETLIEFIEQHAVGILGSDAVYLVRFGPTGLPLVLDPLFSRPTTIIFGGGHISVHLA